MIGLCIGVIGGLALSAWAAVTTYRQNTGKCPLCKQPIVRASGGSNGEPGPVGPPGADATDVGGPS